MAFELKKDNTKWIIGGTGAGWELMPKQTNSMVMVLNDYIQIEKYVIKPDYLMMMDFLDEKPQVVSGTQNLGDTIMRINNMKVPLIAPYKYEEIPLSEQFPLKECVERFGMPYFTNTICYMIAYVLLEGAKEIELFGVNQAGSHEYTEERSGVEYWLGIAVGMGIKVTIHGKDSQLLKFKGRYGGAGEAILYGYLQPYSVIMENEKRFGEIIVRKLIGQKQPYSRLVRKVN